MRDPDTKETYLLNLESECVSTVCKHGNMLFTCTQRCELGFILYAQFLFHIFILTVQAQS